MNRKLEPKRTLKQFGVMLALMAGVVGAIASVVGSLYVICVVLGKLVTHLSEVWNMPAFYVVGLLLLQLVSAILVIGLIVGIFRGFWLWADYVLCEIENKKKGNYSSWKKPAWKRR